MISNPPASSDDAARMLVLAEAYDAEACTRRYEASLTDSPARMKLLLELAETSEAVAIRIRVHVASLPPDPAFSTRCPVDDCSGCHTLSEVYVWLRTDPTVCEYWASQDSEVVQRLAYSLLVLRDGIAAGRWGQG